MTFTGQRAKICSGKLKDEEGIVVSQREPIRDGFIMVRIQLADGRRTGWLSCVSIHLLTDCTALPPTAIA